MKKIIFSLAITLLCCCAYAQTYLPLSGGTLTGTLVLNGAPFVQSTTSGYTMASGSSATVLGTGSGTDYLSYIYGNNPFSIWTNNQSRLIIDGSGNVGIGTTSPNVPLHVSKYGNNVTGNLTLLTTFTDPTGVKGISLGYNQATQAGIIYSENNTGTGSPLEFWTYNGSSFDARMVFTQAGNLGIGTKHPDAELTVNGTIHSKEVKVDNSIPVPDYVFEKTYKLPALNQLKLYLDANHHLPEIPSAAEIEKNGLSLGEMNLKLLKKVEELTLYVIGKDKQLENQQKQINEQDARITALEKALMSLTSNK